MLNNIHLWLLRWSCIYTELQWRWRHTCFIWLEILNKIRGRTTSGQYAVYWFGVWAVSVVIDLGLGFWISSLIENEAVSFLAVGAVSWTDVIAVNIDNALRQLMAHPTDYAIHVGASQFMGILFRHFISLWGSYLSVTRPAYPVLLHFIFKTAGKICGLSMIAAICRDLLTIMTVHLYCFYVYASFLYAVLFQVLLAVFRIFRGKRKNPLRQRVEAYPYSHEEISIGTIMFTVALFCSPALFLYHLVFCAVRLLIIAIHAACGIVQTAFHCILEGIAKVVVAAILRDFPVKGNEVVDVVANFETSKAMDIVEMAHTSDNFSCVQVNVKRRAVQPSWLAVLFSAFTKDKLQLHVPKNATDFKRIVGSIVKGRPTM
eukprot:m.205983 g.205983  ORF g.205983 m.205983 type:complete len:374 (+) comp15793_c0_seq11:272-1393(+)